MVPLFGSVQRFLEYDFDVDFDGTFYNLSNQLISGPVAPLAISALVKILILAEFADLFQWLLIPINRIPKIGYLN